MSYADMRYIENLETILTTGSMEPNNVRPHWPDGEPAPTMRIHNICNTYDLRKEFPILTIRPISIVNATDEMCWIFQKKSTNIKDLRTHIWDAWADENGSVGKTYGYQAGKKYQFSMGEMDQVDRVLWMLTHDPMSRHMIINLWNPADYNEMKLAPCCCWLQFNVEGEDLHMVLYQRSLDMIAAGGWDVTAHALLLMMIARHTGYHPGVFTHFVSNMHVYDRHIPIAKDLVSRHRHKTLQMYPAPVVKFVDYAPTNFYDMMPEHFEFATPYVHTVGLIPKYEVAI